MQHEALVKPAGERQTAAGLRAHLTGPGRSIIIYCVLVFPRDHFCSAGGNEHDALDATGMGCRSHPTQPTRFLSLCSPMSSEPIDVQPRLAPARPAFAAAPLPPPPAELGTTE